MSDTKRKGVPSSSTSRKQPRDASLLSWINATKDVTDSNILLEISEDQMDLWDVTFKLEMFEADNISSRFEVRGDAGWIPLQEDQNEVIRRLLLGGNVFGDGQSCYQKGDYWYEVFLKDGELTQKNLSTDAMRTIRKMNNSVLHSDIVTWFQNHGKGRVPGIRLKLRFPPNFPASPPFVRVVYPRFQQWTGHVTIGGSMCTETLTKSGWEPKMTPVALLLHLKSLIESNGRLDLHAAYDYTEKEAEEAFNRVANDHGWKV